MDKMKGAWEGTKFRICNCEHGMHNCTCDGKTGAKKLECIGQGCDKYIYSKDFETYRCEECYEIWLVYKEVMKNETNKMA